MNYIRLEWTDLSIGLVLVAITIFLARLERVGVTKLLMVGAVRTILQLLAIGFVLKGVFRVEAWWLNLILLLTMIVVATYNAVRRQDHHLRGYARIVFSSLLVGPLTVLAIVALLVIKVSPWYDAQYVIPLGGMIIAWSMNALTLYKNRYDAEIRARRKEIEAKLALGADARRAALTAVREGYRAAMLPTINSMMVVGIVQIPGMMGGQIIGGVNPLDAALYQMVVMFQLAAAGVLSCFVASRLVFRETFTRAHQLTV